MNKITAIALSFLLLYFMTKPIAYTYHTIRNVEDELINPSKLTSLENLEGWSALDDFNPYEVSITNLDDWEDQEQICT